MLDSLDSICVRPDNGGHSFQRGETEPWKECTMALFAVGSPLRAFDDCCLCSFPHRVTQILSRRPQGVFPFVLEPGSFVELVARSQVYPLICAQGDCHHA
jgi:hypothetical protein